MLPASRRPPSRILSQLVFTIKNGVVTRSGGGREEEKEGRVFVGGDGSFATSMRQQATE